MTQVGYRGIAYQVLEWVNEDPHGVLKVLSALALTHTGQNDDLLGKMLLQVLEDVAGTLDQLVVEDLPLLPRL